MLKIHIHTFRKCQGIIVIWILFQENFLIATIKQMVKITAFVHLDQMLWCSNSSFRFRCIIQFLILFTEKIAERPGIVRIFLKFLILFVLLFQGCCWEVFTREMPSSVQRKNWKVPNWKAILYTVYSFYILTLTTWIKCITQHKFLVCLLSDLQELSCFLLSFDWGLRRWERWV